MHSGPVGVMSKWLTFLLVGLVATRDVVFFVEIYDHVGQQQQEEVLDPRKQLSPYWDVLEVVVEEYDENKKLHDVVVVVKNEKKKEENDVGVDDGDELLCQHLYCCAVYYPDRIMMNVAQIPFCYVRFLKMANTLLISKLCVFVTRKKANNCQEWQLGLEQDPRHFSHRLLNNVCPFDT